MVKSKKKEIQKMPVLFIGHGSPENALSNNEFTKGWEKIAKEIPKPKAILCISAHWLSNDNQISSAKKPETIYDFYGFQEELYKIKYPANGNPALAKEIKEALSKVNIKLNDVRGLDHGAWVVLMKMYPEADIPVMQLSIDFGLPLENYFEIGKELQFLRERGVLIIGSGNLVHNLSVLDWENPNNVFPWAREFDEFVKEKLLKQDYSALINYKKQKTADLAHPTNDHFIPLIYTIGAAKGEKPKFFNENITLGSLSMRCILFG